MKKPSPQTEVTMARLADFPKEEAELRLYCSSTTQSIKARHSSDIWVGDQETWSHPFPKCYCFNMRKAKVSDSVTFP